MVGMSDQPEPADTSEPLLSEAEHRALQMTADLWNLLSGEIIDSGPAGPGDRAELASHIHAIQQAVMSQAAARAYPDLLRPLGGWPVGDGRDHLGMTREPSR